MVRSLSFLVQELLNKMVKKVGGSSRDFLCKNITAMLNSAALKDHLRSGVWDECTNGRSLFCLTSHSRSRFCLTSHSSRLGQNYLKAYDLLARLVLSRLRMTFKGS
jgi:hypothetical protein